MRRSSEGQVLLRQGVLGGRPEYSTAVEFSSSPAAGQVELRLEQHRRDLTGHCLK
ncbi:hypothetical protein WME91_37960 [Sorangium sp. So ce269]